MAAQHQAQTILWNAQAPAGVPYLLGFFATGHARDWQLAERMTVGRMGSGAQIEVPSSVVSSQHGEFGVAQGRVFYRDLGSTNGSWLDGKRVTSTVELREGSVLELARDLSGQAAFAFVLAHVSPRGLVWQQVPFGPDVQQVVLGRATGDVTLADPFASERHAAFFHSTKGTFVLDLQSTNGVWLGPERVQGSAPLTPGTVVRVGTTWVYAQAETLWVGAFDLAMGTAGQMMSQPQQTGKAHVGQTGPHRVEAPPSGTGAQKKTGSDKVDRDGWTPQPQPQPQPGEALQQKPVVSTQPQSGGLVIDIQEKNVWNRLKKKTLLRDVHLSVNPGDFVLILGGSGAGKSTFLNAVMGNSKAEGTIRLGDIDVYEEYQRIKYQIGYVPQQSDLRMSDTVRDTIVSAARLRMSRGTSRHESEARALWAAELMGITEVLDSLVGDISGGQQKRVSTAVQLVGDPMLFFLDEPDSGLDAKTSKNLMKNLRDIADLGKMVLLITHGPDRGAELFTKVIVLAKADRDGAGHLVFCGTVEETKAFFGVSTLEDVVGRINRKDEGGEGLADYYLEQWEAMQRG